jgi:serine protease Do
MLELMQSHSVATVPSAVGGFKPGSPSQVVRANNGETGVEKSWRTLGLRLEEIGENETHLVRPRYRGGMRVRKVRSQSPAELNGIRPGDILVGLHVWETINHANIDYVVEHPQLATFNPLKFYILRGEETLYGHLQVGNRE